MMSKAKLPRLHLFGRKRPPLAFADFMRELKLLRLAGTQFWPRDYAQRLADYCSMSIKLTRCNDVEYPLLQAKLLHHRIGGGLFLEPHSRTAWIVVPDSLDTMTQIRIAFHELGHLAAGDPYGRRFLLRSDDQAGPLPMVELRDDGKYYPLVRLSKREPSGSYEQCEDEANLRTNYAVKAGFFGEQIYYRDEFFFALKDRKALPFL